MEFYDYMPEDRIYNRKSRRGRYVNRNLQSAGHADKALKKRRAQKKATRKAKKKEVK